MPRKLQKSAERCHIGDVREGMRPVTWALIAVLAIDLCLAQLFDGIL